MLERRSDSTKSALETLEAQVETFRRERLKLLDARLAAQTAQLEAAAARASQAGAAKRRIGELAKTGSATAAENDRTRFEWAAANAIKSAEEKRRDETQVERDAILKGVFVGDSYNDSPNSQQRASELRLKADELDAQAAAVRSQIKLIADQIVEEEARVRQRAEAVVELPSSGRVWEMLTAPGERVGKGQDLMRVLDCSHPLVSANVDESVYNRLEVGGRATFRPSQHSDKSYPGVIVSLTGAAAASGNFAIPLAVMRKTSFYVTVAVDGMSEGCAVGRTGTVTYLTSNGLGNGVAAASARDGYGLGSLKARLF